MRLIASDFVTQYRPHPCDLRLWLKHRGGQEREPTVSEEVLRRLGERHEREHLAISGTKNNSGFDFGVAGPPASSNPRVQS